MPFLNSITSFDISFNIGLYCIKHFDFEIKMNKCMNCFYFKTKQNTFK